MNRRQLMKEIERMVSGILTVIIVFVCLAVPVNAHEIFPGYSLRMQDRNSEGGPLLYVHYKYMRDEGAPAHYYDCAIAAINAWDGYANVTDGVCNQLIPTEMNISFRCSEDVWSSLGLSSSVLG